MKLILIVAAIFSLGVRAALEDNLELWLSFDNGDLSDSSVNQMEVIDLYSPPSYVGDSPTGGLSASFYGWAAFTTTMPVPNIGGNSPFSMSMWVKPADHAPWWRQFIALLGQQWSGSHHWINEPTSSYAIGTLWICTWDATSPCNQRQVMSPFDWTHVMVSYDGDWWSRIYVNGKIFAYQNNQYNIEPDSAMLSVGTDGYGFFFGAIDEIKIWSRSLSETEALELYESEVVFPPVDLSAGLALWMPLDGDLSDVSGNDIQFFESFTATSFIDGSPLGAGQVAHLDGTGGFSSGGAIPGIGGWDPFSVAFWIKVPDSPINHREWIINIGPYSDGAVMITHNGGGSSETNGIEVANWNAELPLTPYPLIPANTWCHIVVTYDYSRMTTWINGERYSDYDAWYTMWMDWDPHFQVGFTLYGPEMDKHLYADMDDIRAYSRSLTELEVKTLWQMGDHHVELIDGLKLFIPFDGGLADLTANTTIKFTEYANKVQFAESVLPGYGSQAGFFNSSGFTTSKMPVGLRGDTPFTVSLWLKPHDSSPVDLQYVFNLGPYTPGALSLTLQETTGQFPGSIGFLPFSSSLWKPSARFTPEADSWTHAVITYDGQWVRVYYNNELLSFNRNKFHLGATRTSQLVLGNFFSDDEEYPIKFYNGLIDDFRVWTRALSHYEISQLYNRVKTAVKPHQEILTAVATNGADGFNLYDSVSTDIGSSSAIGDINGDGFSDIAVANTEKSEIRVLFGKSAERPRFATINEELQKDGSGFTISSVTGPVVFAGSIDINGDGKDDLIFSTPTKTCGKVYILYGRSGTWSKSFASSAIGSSISGAVLYPQDGDCYLGSAIAPVGDIDGDSKTDLAITSFNGGYEQHIVYVLRGSASISSPLEVSNSNLLKFVVKQSEDSSLYPSIAKGGDINGDNTGDLLIGDRAAAAGSRKEGTGRVYVVYGSSYIAGLDVQSSLDGTNGFAITSGSLFDNIGTSVAGADFNGDALSDIIIGAPHSSHFVTLDNYGKVAVLYGQHSFDATVDLTAAVNQESASFFEAPGRFGAIILSLGDINGDSLSEFIVGAPGADFQSGRKAGQAYLVHGSSESLRAAEVLIILGENMDETAFSSVSVGDFNGDKKADIFMGATRNLNETRSYVLFAKSLYSQTQCTATAGSKWCGSFCTSLSACPDAMSVPYVYVPPSSSSSVFSLAKSSEGVPLAAKGATVGTSNVAMVAGATAGSLSAVFVVVILVVLFVVKKSSTRQSGSEDGSGFMASTLTGSEMLSTNKSIAMMNNKMNNMAAFVPSGAMVANLKDHKLVADGECEWVVTPQKLAFGAAEGARLDVGVIHSQELVIENLSTNKMTFMLHPIFTSQYSITMDKMEGTLMNDDKVTIAISIELHCSFVVDVGLPVSMVYVDKGKEQREYRLVKVSVRGKASSRIDYDEIVLVKPVGEGSFGIVYKAKWRGYMVAVKQLKTQVIQFDDVLRTDFEKEVERMERLRSPHCVHFYGAVFSPGKLCMVTEFCEYGSLGAIYKKNKVNDYFMVRCELDAARGMNFLHAAKMLHRDLKPDNMLIVTNKLDSPVLCKLTDFGTSRGLTETTAGMTQGVGTPLYMAPEIMAGSINYATSADVYSFGMIMWELWEKKTPFQEEGINSLYLMSQYVKEGKHLKISESCPADYAQLLKAAWSVDPDERPQFGDIVGVLEKILGNMTAPRPDEVLFTPQ